MNYILSAAVLAVVLVGCNSPAPAKSSKKIELDKWYPADELHASFAEGQNDLYSKSGDSSSSLPSFFTVQGSARNDNKPAPDHFFDLGRKQQPVQNACCVEKPRRSVIGVDLEFLWFKAMQDGIKYGQYNPQTPSFNPTSHPIDQEFEYSAGSRVTLKYLLPTHCEMLRLNWMYYHSHPETRSKNTSDHSVLAVLSLPTYGITENQLANSVKGHWMVNMNSFDFDVAIPLCLARCFELTPFGGLKLGFVDEHVSAHYKDFIDVSEEFLFQPANTPLAIRAKSKMWGLGPMVGLDGRVSLPSDFGVFFSASVAPLAGRFKLRTVYSQMLNTIPEATVTVKDKIWRLSIVEQLKAGIDKRWTFCMCNNKEISIDFALGWEIQIWTNQWRVNMFDSFVEPTAGEDLSLYGPFAKLGVWF